MNEIVIRGLDAATLARLSAEAEAAGLDLAAYAARVLSARDAASAPPVDAATAARRREAIAAMQDIARAFGPLPADFDPTAEIRRDRDTR